MGPVTVVPWWSSGCQVLLRALLSTPDIGSCTIPLLMTILVIIHKSITQTKIHYFCFERTYFTLNYIY